MATTAGVLSLISAGAQAATLSSAVATAGAAPYTYQWYRSTATGFTPGGGNLIAGATSLSLNDTGLTPSTQYYYKVVATDSGAVAGTSTQLAVATSAAVPSPNQFKQAPYLGQLDLFYNGDTVPCQFDPNGTGTLVSGQAVKFSTTVGGLPMVVPCTAAADVCAGFVNYNSKYAQFIPGDPIEISMAGNVMYLQAALAINRGASLTSLPSAVAGGTVGGVVPITGSSGFPIVGFSLDTVAIGQLTRVMIKTPVAPYAHD